LRPGYLPGLRRAVRLHRPPDQLRRARRPRRDHPMTTTAVIPRGAAVHAIAAHLADRDAFVLLVPPGMVPTVAHRLANLATTRQARRARWTGYLDIGLPTVLRTHSSDALAMLPLVVSHFGATTTAVITVPKTIPATTLAAALGAQLADD